MVTSGTRRPRPVGARGTDRFRVLGRSGRNPPGPYPVLTGDLKLRHPKRPWALPGTGDREFKGPGGGNGFNGTWGWDRAGPIFKF